MAEEVSAEALLQISREDAWQKLSDISLPHNYVPGIIKTEIVGDLRQGVGASRYVYRSERSYIQETVTEWTEGEGFRIRLHKGEKSAPPFKSAWFRYHLSDGPVPGTTLFTPSMGYELPWGPLGRWLEKRLAKTVQKTIADVAISMKLYYESGEPTTPQALRAHKSVQSAS